MVYFGSHDFHIYALDMKTGKEEWLYETDGMLLTSPIVYKGIVYFECDNKHLYALDAKTGEYKWAYKTGTRRSRNKSTIASEGLVYVCHEVGIWAIDIE